MSQMLIEYPKCLMLKWKRPRGCVERDNLRAEISNLGAPLLILISKFVWCEEEIRSDGRWTGEPRLVGQGIAHLKLTL